ncbi:MAG: hypothetical protein GON13_03270 [Nanoarchaeota archaeon]|nr:hypothetical protein [Nanoarchaeota archaeon]
MKGQVGVEYLMILSFLLLMTSIFAKYYSDVSISNGVDVVVRASLDNFEKAADNVFVMGVPAVRFVRINLPEKVIALRTGLNGSVVQISYYDNQGGVVDAFRNFNYNFSGSFPNVTGNYEIVLYSLGFNGVGVNMT